MLDTTMHKTDDEDKLIKKKHTTQYATVHYYKFCKMQGKAFSKNVKAMC